MFERSVDYHAFKWAMSGFSYNLAGVIDDGKPIDKVRLKEIHETLIHLLEQVDYAIEFGIEGETTLQIDESEVDE